MIIEGWFWSIVVFCNQLPIIHHPTIWVNHCFKQQCTCDPGKTPKLKPESQQNAQSTKVSLPQKDQNSAPKPLLHEKTSTLSICDLFFLWSKQTSHIKVQTNNKIYILLFVSCFMSCLIKVNWKITFERNICWIFRWEVEAQQSLTTFGGICPKSSVAPPGSSCLPVSWCFERSSSSCVPLFAFQCPPVATLCVHIVSTESEERASVRHLVSHKGRLFALRDNGSQQCCHLSWWKQWTEATSGECFLVPQVTSSSHHQGHGEQ